MSKYKIMITETSQREIEVEADDFDQAKERVEEMYNNSEIILDEADYMGIEINESPFEFTKDNIENDLNYESGFAKNEFLNYMYSEFPSVYHTPHSRELLENVVNYCTSNRFDVKNKLIPTLEILVPEINRNEIIQFVDIKNINTKDYSSEYQLLARLKSDCDYFLGYGYRNPNNLWAKDVSEQIEKMKEVYEILPLKPNWLSMSDISNYEKLMINTNAITKISSIDDLKQAIENIGWHVYESNIGLSMKDWKISKYSPAGQEFVFTIYHYNDIEEVICEIDKYACCFDVNEHVKMWIDANNNDLKNIPSISELVDEARGIQEMLDKLSDYCNNLNVQLMEEENALENEEEDDWEME